MIVTGSGKLQATVFIHGKAAVGSAVPVITYSAKSVYISSR